jgi:hypothetical protein
MRLKTPTLLLALALAGCATCQEHPAFCAVGAAVVAGSIAATIEVNQSDRRGATPGTSTVQPVHCTGNPLCQ